MRIIDIGIMLLLLAGTLAIAVKDRQTEYERDVWHWKYDLIDPIRAEAGLPLKPFPKRPWFVTEKPGTDLP